MKAISFQSKVTRERPMPLAYLEGDEQLFTYKIRSNIPEQLIDDLQPRLSILLRHGS